MQIRLFYYIFPNLGQCLGAFLCNRPLNLNTHVRILERTRDAEANIQNVHLPVGLQAQFVQSVCDLCTCQNGAMTPMEVNTHRHGQQLRQNWNRQQRQENSSSHEQ